MDGLRKFSLPLVRTNRRKDSTTLKGPIRVFRLCLLSILVPGLLIAGPLYLRYRVFSEQVYPLGISDMRLVDGRISTTWCQKQLVRSNGTFSAYLLPEEPKIKSSPIHVSMVRYLNLEDDMKEYWGFYLLKGSTVTVSTCCRWPGASLIVIKGHSHLRECAYIGDNSSEELQELEKLDQERAGLKEPVKKPSARHEVWPLKKARASIEFYGSEAGPSDDTSGGVVGDESNTVESDAFSKEQEMISINLNQSSKSEENGFRPTAQAELLPNIENTKNSEEILNNIASQIASLGNRSTSLISRLKKMLAVGSQNMEQRFASSENNAAQRQKNSENDNYKSPSRKREVSIKSLEKELYREDESSNAALEEGLSSRDEIRGQINGTTANDMSNSEFWSSFSSSEERLLSCAGLILNLPLNPSKSCHPSKSENTQAKASLTNKLTYEIPSDGYYFFVFSSENEIQPNYIRIHFNLQKMLYNVSNPLAACTNTTDSCSLPLNFFSREKVVLEMPFNSNETLWNQEYVVVSVCEPRTMVYAACVIAVPIIILFFAF